jgi:hypothetical protein
MAWDPNVDGMRAQRAADAVSGSDIGIALVFRPHDVRARGVDSRESPIQKAYVRCAAAAPAREALGEEAWAAAFVAGRALSLEEAIAEALDTPPE